MILNVITNLKVFNLNNYEAVVVTRKLAAGRCGEAEEPN